jgi:hypothetical protein
MKNMKNFLINIFTSADNSTFSMSKLIGFFGGFSMIAQFIRVSSVDFQGFAIGLAALIGAFALKSATDAK